MKMACNVRAAKVKQLDMQFDQSMVKEKVVSQGCFYSKNRQIKEQTYDDIMNITEPCHAKTPLSVCILYTLRNLK